MQKKRAPKPYWQYHFNPWRYEKRYSPRATMPKTPVLPCKATLAIGFGSTRAYRFSQSRFSHAALSSILAALAAGCAESRQPDWLATSRHAMVATDHALASHAGLEILQAGGNAVDAAIAVSLALAVTRPESTGLGGGGFMIVRTADGEVTALDYRERAPAAATPDMFTCARAAEAVGLVRVPMSIGILAPTAAGVLSRDAATTAVDSHAIPPNPAPSQLGHLAVAVPGHLAGLAEAHERWGTMPWPQLAGPAYRSARQGFAVDDHYVDAARTVNARYTRYPQLKKTCAYVYRVHLREGRLRAPGEILRQPELARAMRAIADHGPEHFAHKQLAPAVAEEMAAHGGIVTEEDLQSYQVTQREPLRGTYRGYEIIAMPPPSSGGTCVLQTLNILEHLPFAQAMRDDQALAAHYLVEAMKHAFADRARWLGDADFAPVPTDLLTSTAYAKSQAGEIRADRTGTPASYGAAQLPDDAGTSHFCIVDRWGNAVVSTETVNTSFGSLAAVEKYGIILNNEMDDFTAEPDTANFFGLQQSPHNAVEPHKRPLSSMSPTMLLANGRPVLLLGASGGPRIISAVLNVMLRVIDAKMPLDEAITAIRVHHQWQPDTVYLSFSPSAALHDGLIQRGHQIAEPRGTGMVQAIRVTKHGLIGASDPRKGGQPAGY
jgi:gamma-glutamyltranspeptidase/glutathione hydrolase